MAYSYGSKFLFSIFMVGNGIASLNEKFPADLTAKANAESEFRPDAIATEHAASLLRSDGSARVEQIGFYLGVGAGVLVGVAAADGLIEIAADGKPQMVKDSNNKSKVQAFIDSLVMQVGPAGANSTWIVAPLDELCGDSGTLHVGGMGGISGGSPTF